MSFDFRTSNNINAGKYEGVKLISVAPKNPEDFNGMQDILRYRQVMMIKELYGNARLKSTNPIFDIHGDRGKFNATYYLDGYRIELINHLTEETISSLSTAQTSYDVYMSLKFDIVNYTEDSSIALIDPVSKNAIPTSERYKFKVAINITNTKLSDSPGTYTAAYHIGTLTYRSLSWNFEDATDKIAIVEMTYAEAIQEMQNAIHVDTNGWATVQKLTTGDTTVNAFIEKVSADNIQFGFRSGTGEPFTAWEVVNYGNEWLPIIWMRSMLNAFPKSFMRSDAFGIQGDSTYAMSVDSRNFSIGSNGSSLGFDVTPVKMHFKNLDNKTGLKVTQEANSITNLTFDLVHVGGITQPADSGYELKYELALNQPATLKFSLPRNTTNKPSDSIFLINQRIVPSSGNANGTYVTLTVWASEDSDSDASYVVHKTYTWPLTSTSVGSVEMSYPVSRVDSALYFKLVYALDIPSAIESGTHPKAVVQFKADDNVSGKKYVYPNPLTEVTCLRMGDNLLWLSPDGKLKAKKKVNDNIGTDIYSLMTNDGGDSLTSPGGMEIGGGGVEVQVLSTITGYPENVDGVLTFPVVNEGQGTVYGLIAQETVEDIYSQLETAMSGGITLLETGVVNASQLRPMFAQSGTTARLNFNDIAVGPSNGYGLLSKTDYDAFKSNLDTLNSATLPPSDAWYVSNDFTFNSMYHKSPTLQEAITHITNHYFDDGNDILRYTIFVEPGTYSTQAEDAWGVLYVPHYIDIIATNPNATVLRGQVIITLGYSKLSHNEEVRQKININIYHWLREDVSVEDQCALKFYRAPQSGIAWVFNSRPGTPTVPTGRLENIRYQLTYSGEICIAGTVAGYTNNYCISFTDVSSGINNGTVDLYARSSLVIENSKIYSKYTNDIMHGHAPLKIAGIIPYLYIRNSILWNPQTPNLSETPPATGACMLLQYNNISGYSNIDYSTETLGDFVNSEFYGYRMANLDEAQQSILRFFAKSIFTTDSDAEDNFPKYSGQVISIHTAYKPSKAAFNLLSV